MTRGSSTATFTGIVVVCTAAFVTAALTLGSLWAYLVARDPEAGKELLLQAIGSLGITVAISSRTRTDPDTVRIDQPASMPVPVDPQLG